MCVYPVLIHKQKGKVHFYGFAKEDQLKETSKELLRRGVFDDCFLIDATGKRYKIKSVKEIGWATPFFGFSLFRKGRQIQVDFDLEYIDTLELSELKTTVLENVNPKNYFSEIIEMVRDAKSVADVISLFE